jgi:hypothetical protein
VTTTDTGTGGHEVLAHGPDDPPRQSLVTPFAVGAVCFALGFLAGGVEEVTADRGDEAVASTLAPAVVPAAVVRVTDDLDDARFGFPLFNPGEERIKASVVSMQGWLPALTHANEVSIPSRTWGFLPFSAPADCAVPPSSVQVAYVRLETTLGVREQAVHLPEAAEPLQVHHEKTCAARR